MDEKIKTGPLRFHPNIIMERALFDWPIKLQYRSKVVAVKYRLISSKFLGMKFFQPSVPLTNQKPPAFVSVQ